MRCRRYIASEAIGPGTESFSRRRSRQAVWSVNSNLPLASVRTMDEIYRQSLANLLRTGYAGNCRCDGARTRISHLRLISYTVIAKRTREIGHSVDLEHKEASSLDVVRSGLVWTGIGVAIRLASAVGLMHLMKSILFRTSPLEPLYVHRGTSR